MALKDYKILQGLGIETLSGSEIRILPYDGNPEGNVIAEPGSICADTTSGKLYKKASGSSNSGWEEIISGNNSSWKEPVVLASTEELDVVASGTGIGKTLTENSNGKLTLDGVDALIGQRVLIKNQGDTLGDAADNGIYTVTAVGDGSNPFVLTRAIDADANSEIGNGTACLVTSGSTLNSTVFYISSSDPIDIDVDDIIFSSIKVIYTASAGVKLVGSDFQADLSATGGLEIDGNDQIAINVDATNNTTEINANNELAVVGMKNDSGTLTAGPDIVDSVALSDFTDIMFHLVVTNGTDGKYSCVVHATGVGTTVDYSISSIIKVGTITKPTIDVDINTGNVELSVTGINGYTYNVKRIAN